MAVALGVLAVLCAHVHWIDVRWRVVLLADVAALVGLRLALLAAAEAGAFGVVEGAFSAGTGVPDAEPSALDAVAGVLDVVSDAPSLQGAALAAPADKLAVSWGASALAESALLAIAVVFALAAVAFAMRVLTGKRCLGGGDVQLYAVCCLFLDASGVLALLALSSFGGLVAAACAALRRERTFAFAPVIVWSLFAVLLLAQVL